MGSTGSDGLRIARTNRRSQRAYPCEFEVDSDAWTSIVFSTEAPSAWLDSGDLPRKPIGSANLMGFAKSDSSAHGSREAHELQQADQAAAPNRLHVVSSKLIWRFESLSCFNAHRQPVGCAQTICWKKRLRNFGWASENLTGFYNRFFEIPIGFANFGWALQHDSPRLLPH